MTDCYIYDAIRTPRGKGKKNGTLHEVTALELSTQVLNNINNTKNKRQRRPSLSDVYGKSNLSLHLS